jgi:hypothetical protein
MFLLSLGAGDASTATPTAVAVSEVTGQQQVAAAHSVTVSHPAPSSDGLLQLEPPLSSSDYSFSLDEQENLNDLFEFF